MVTVMTNQIMITYCDLFFKKKIITKHIAENETLNMKQHVAFFFG